jgi:hypothetical protein
VARNQHAAVGKWLCHRLLIFQIWKQYWGKLEHPWIDVLGK